MIRTECTGTQSTGAMMSMGKGAVVNMPRKHLFNVVSLTDSELVYIADILGVMMWCKYFWRRRVID